MQIFVRDAIRQALIDEMKRDLDIVVFGEEIGKYNGAYKVTKGLLDAFGGDRVIDTPISEYGMSGIGVGCAFSGLRPIIEFMSFNFSLQAIDHIINSASCTLFMSGGAINVPIVFRGPNGFAPGVSSQHSRNLSSIYSHIPGLKVVAPYHARDFYGLLCSSIRDNDPVVFLEHEVLYGHEHEIGDPLSFKDIVPIGQSKRVKSGEDVTLVSYGMGVHYALLASDILENQDGITCDIIDLRTLRPLDYSLVEKSIKKTSRLLCIDEDTPFCGISSEVISQSCEKVFDYLDHEPVRVCQKDVPLPYAKDLEDIANISVCDVVDNVRSMLK